MNRRKYRAKASFLGICACLAAAFLLLCASPSYVLAEDKYWIGGSGYWNDPANWDPYGIPAFDIVYLTSSDAIDRTVILDERLYLDSLYIDAAGSETITLEILQDSGFDVPGKLEIGVNGTATINQSGGSVTDVWNAGFYLGSGGTYNLSGGGMALFYMPIDGMFNQSGGSVYGESLSLRGTYNLSAGEINEFSDFGYLEIYETGTFNQSGGLHLEPIGSRIMGGTYNLSGGQFTTDGAPNYGLQIENNGTFSQTGGSTFLSAGGSIDDTSTYNLAGGALTANRWYYPEIPSILNNGTFNYSGGSMYLRLEDGTENEGIFINNGTANLSGNGTRTVNGNVVNNGTWKTTHTTAEYTGTFTNNGAYISDSAAQYFADLIVGESGYLVAQFKDEFYIGGDFINHSMMNNDWNTMHAYLAFFEGSDNLHDVYLTGVDYGQTMSGYAKNFSWGTWDITDDYLTLYDGNEELGAGLYLREIWGAEITPEMVVANLIGFEGLTIYYMPHLPGNDYLGGFAYNLTGGGQLAPVPEPATILLVTSGLVGLAGFRRKFRKR